MSNPTRRDEIDKITPHDLRRILKAIQIKSKMSNYIKGILDQEVNKLLPIFSDLTEEEIQYIRDILIKYN